MKRPVTLALGLAALGLWGTGAAAGPYAPPADPANARALVPATRHEPLLPVAAALAPLASPPDAWKALNRVVASFDAMALTMDMQEPTAAPPKGHAQHEPPQQHQQHQQHQHREQK